MPNEDDIIVRINGQTHRLRTGEPESLRKIPWPQRKRLIEVLEAIKKAEYIDPFHAQDATSHKPETVPDSSQISQAITNKPKVVAHSSRKSVNSTSKHNNSALDGDVLMQRFLAEQQTHKSSIPSKSTVYKWFLIIFAVILLLVLVF